LREWRHWQWREKGKSEIKSKQKLLSVSLRASGSLGSQWISSSPSTMGFKIALRISVADSILSYRRKNKEEEEKSTIKLLHVKQ
jgi:hypothetical protein